MSGLGGCNISPRRCALNTLMFQRQNKFWQVTEAGLDSGYVILCPSSAGELRSFAVKPKSPGPPPAQIPGVFSLTPSCKSCDVVCGQEVTVLTFHSGSSADRWSSAAQVNYPAGLIILSPLRCRRCQSAAPVFDCQSEASSLRLSQSKHQRCFT